MWTSNYESSSHPPCWQELLDHLPVAAYTCDSVGRLTYFNSRAEAVWGRTAALRDSAQLYCGSHRMYSPDGSLLPHAQCWMARALLEGKPYNGYEIIIEQENGRRNLGVAYANPVRNPQGQVIGAINLVISKIPFGSLSANSTSGRAGAVDDAALAMAEVTLGIFANLAWPASAFI